MKKIIVAALLFGSISAYAQHEHHNVESKTNSSSHEQHEKSDKTMDMSAGHEHMDMGNMSHSLSLNLPMNRNGSGTSWLPDAAPMYGYMVHSKKWMYMFHGNLFLRYNNQDIANAGYRGDAKIDAPNWIMGMGQRTVGQKGLFRFNVMLSLDALTIGGSGYPLLFQSGESWNGKPLVDRQHPHDLFSELSVSYSYALSKKADVYAYVGYPGEPALGAVAFMHRPSALYNPDAPLSHHWIDATHITFGVATLGFRYGKFKIEGSSFTGREPDENRYDFDKPRFDSRSARLSFNPNKNWALQVSHGFIKSPEELHTGEDVYRTTASAIYAKRIGKDMLLNATAIWGLNKTLTNAGEHAALVEAGASIKKLSLYMRYEFVQKSAEELDVEKFYFSQHDIFNVNAITLGAGYNILNLGQLKLAGGAQASLYFTPKYLQSVYGKMPIGIEAYLRLYPTLMR